MAAHRQGRSLGVVTIIAAEGLTMTSSSTRRSVAAAGVCVALFLGAVPAAEAGFDPKPGAEGLGDPVLPGLGNGGYDVREYTVGYRFEPGVSTMESTVEIAAVATQDLSRFNLDFAGGRVHDVRVGGEPAEFVVEGQELVVTPAEPLRGGQRLGVQVRYVADRDAQVPSSVDETAGWANNADGGFAFWAQPDRAHLFFPANDYPADKARITYRVDVPAGWNVVANGTLTDRLAAGDREEFEYRTEQPITTQSAQLAVGRLTTVTGTGPRGLPLRSAAPSGQVTEARAALERIPGHLAWLEETIGREFPLETYGILGIDGHGPMQTFALENATLSSFPARALFDADEVEPVLVHEAAHQWFGNSVSFNSFSDVWLSEGFASYLDTLWSAQHGGESLDDVFRSFYEREQQVRDAFGSPVAPTDPQSVFGVARGGGSLAIYALRLQAGERDFQRIMGALLDEYRDRSVTTAEFRELVAEVAGPDTGAFLDTWLDADDTPPMPGRPGWKPVT